ncbi:MAG: glutamyl-tRNA reductase [Bryobacteraceae bacterium]
MKLWITGLNHKTAPVAVRERLAFKPEDLIKALQQLRQQPGVAEGMILSTCNRVEVAVAADDGIDAQASVESFLSSNQHLDRDWLQPYLYGFAGREAIRHLFRVAASLDSMVVGEPQILGQLKSAYSLAKEHGAVNGLLDTIVTRAFSVAKRVRTETDIGASAVSISYAAVELAKEIFGSLKGKGVMLIGAGKMSELAARHLHRSGVARILVANRTQARADEVAAMVRGKVVPYRDFRDHIKDVDIVITSSGATDFLLRRDDMKPTLDARRNRPMFLIDIAVPRNIDPLVNELDNIFLYDIDDLQKVVNENLKGRMDEAAEADLIVSEEVERLESWLLSRQAGPMIASLQDQLERLRQMEIEKMRSKLGGLSAQQELAIEQLTRRIVNKIAHGPISHLRRSAGNSGDTAVLEAIRNMFRLEES